VKASRLLSLLLLLQTHHRMTSRELSERFEVSRRTILRDIEALAEAGVPVYTERGRHGGVALLAEARLNASHLEPDEMEALMLTGLDRERLRQLGLQAVADQAGRKLAARRAQGPASASSALAHLIVIDNTAWMEMPAVGVDASDLAAALRHGCRLRIRYRRSGADEPADELVDPYGLAFKSGRWYLVADVAAHPRLFALERLHSFESLTEPWRHRESQTLATVWSQLNVRVERRGDIAVRAWIRVSRLDLARRILGTRLSEVGPANGEWRLMTVRYETIEGVRQLLQFGDHVKVVEPVEARHRIFELAGDLAANHGPGPEAGPPASSEGQAVSSPLAAMVREGEASP
jgi:predicted DNA-binding transcriptional regulator YafY